MRDICVVGGINMDLVVQVPHIPRPGETVHGGEVARFPGGKGANQAVAARHLGASVAMVGQVGADAFGDELIKTLDAVGVESSGVRRVADRATGVALISVASDGQNAIVVAPGANMTWDEAAVVDVEGAVSWLPDPRPEPGGAPRGHRASRPSGKARRRPGHPQSRAASGRGRVGLRRGGLLRAQPGRGRALRR